MAYGRLLRMAFVCPRCERAMSEPQTEICPLAKRCCHRHVAANKHCVLDGFIFIRFIAIHFAISSTHVDNANSNFLAYSMFKVQSTILNKSINFSVSARTAMIINNTCQAILFKIFCLPTQTRNKYNTVCNKLYCFEMKGDLLS